MRTCPRCGSGASIGDNNGFSCRDCGTQLSGYGYGGHGTKCLHDWDDEPYMKMKMCTYCETVVPNDRYDPKKDNYRLCPECNRYTEHALTLYNPDYPDDGEAWQCSVCEEITQIFEPGK